MKILFVSQAPLKKELGGAKVVIELAEEMESLGWECRLTSLMELVPGPIRDGGEVYATALGEHLRRHGDQYDVIDYDHCYLPFSRTEFSARTLLVARSVLLAHHLLNMRASSDGRFGGRLRSFFRARIEHARMTQIVERAQRTIDEADLANVANQGDKETLLARGVPDEKIVVLPYGLSRTERASFDQVADDAPAAPRIAFVGTFDRRKGASDLPEIVETIASALPEASFRLLGTFKDGSEILGAFASAVRSRIEVVPSYPTGSLRELLASCSAGMFPSYLEGFGFGVLEMLAAGLPVIAYDVPGPPMMLSAEYLVGAGDRAAMSRKLIALLKDREKLQAARRWARQRSRDFAWSDVARRTSEAYRSSWDRLVSQ